jgi:NADPH:quinone reductase-like Zn-dependent oxidoreductase
LVTRWIGDKRVKIGIARYKREHVLLLKELVEQGKYRPVIDRSYPLEQVVDATKYVERGKKTGNVVITVRAD